MDMANYKLPVFPLTINIWRFSTHLGVLPPILSPDVISVANLTIGQRQVGSAMTGGFLLVPFNCDIRSSESGVFSSGTSTDFDLVEVPAGSGRYYSVSHPVEYSARGFLNEHKIVNIVPGLPELGSGTGPAGPAGPAGPPGEDGPPGEAGPPGEDGPAGSAGATGSVGPAGSAGPTGSVGPAGPTGSVGPAGSAGATGAAGSNGQGVPTGGTANQHLAKIDSTNFNTAWVTPSSAVSYGGFVLGNGYLVATVASNALTIAIKNSITTTDPTSTDPVTCTFSNTNGTYTTLSLTASCSLVVSSGSTLGTISAKPHRLWIVLFNDSATPRLGIIRPTTVVNGSSSVTPLRDYMTASSIAEGGAGASDSAGVFYTGTAVTTKSLRIIGWIESQQSTAGTWATTPSIIHLQTSGDPLPGAIVQEKNSTQSAMTTLTGSIPFDNTIPQASEGVSVLSMSNIARTSACNVCKINVNLQLASASDSVLMLAVFLDSVTDAITAGMWTMTAASVNIIRYDLYYSCDFSLFNATNSTLMVRIGGSASSSLTLNGFTGSQYMGGVLNSWITATEIMA